MIFEKICTRDMSEEAWVEARKGSIGGSDAAAIVGLNSYKSAYALWAEKSGRIEPEDISMKEAVRLGHELEPYVAKRFTEITGKKVRRENYILKNTEYPWAHANVDRLVIGEKAGLECKTTSALSLSKFKNGEYPANYYVQCVRLSEEIELNFMEDEAQREKLPIIGYVGYYRLVNGFEKTIYMSKSQIEAHERKHRKGEYMGKGWREDWDAMARKTVYRRLIGKWGVMSIDYQSNQAGAMLAQQMEAEYGPSDYTDLSGVPDAPEGYEVDPGTGEVVENG